jgi:hypothetical protein
VKLVREYINEKFTEKESDPIKDMNIGLVDVIYICGNCGELVDQHNEQLPYESEERKKVERTLKILGEDNDRMKMTWCNYCQNIEQQNYEAEEREKEREREKAEEEERIRWEEENRSREWEPY